MYDFDAALAYLAGAFVEMVNATGSKLSTSLRRAYSRALTAWIDSKYPDPPDTLLDLHAEVAAVAEPETWATYAQAWEILLFAMSDLYAIPDIEVDPGGWRRVPLGVYVPSRTPIADAWQAAQPGELIQLAPGRYWRVSLKRTKRPAGSEQVTIRGAFSAPSIWIRDTAVGSTDTLFLQEGLEGLILDNVELENDDRSAIKTAGDQIGEGAQRVTLRRVFYHGFGGPTTAHTSWDKDTKWGGHHYLTGNWVQEDCRVEGIFQEHGIGYFHSQQGDHTFRRCIAKWCGRTALFFVSRKKDYTAIMPVGYGNVLVEDCEAHDVGIGDGASAFSFRGGAPGTDVVLRRTKVRLGCDPTLKLPWSDNIAGGLVVDHSSESVKGAGDDAHDGLYREVVLDEFDSEIGEVFVGKGSARRTNAMLGNAEKVVMRNSRLVQHPGASQYAAEFYRSMNSLDVIGTNQVIGMVLFKGMRYNSWTAFLDAVAAGAHPEVKVS